MNLFDSIIVQPILNILLGIYSLIPGGDFGVALIIFTILIRFLLYPLVKRQLHQTRMMRKLQPELKRIKKEAAGDRQKEAALMMQLYKERDVKPFRSFLILLLQLPIFIGIFSVVRIFTSHNGAELHKYTYGFLQHVGPIQHLIQHPSQLNLNFLGLFDLTKTASSGDIFLIILALIAAGTQYIMSKQLMPNEKGAEKKTLRSILRESATGKEADQAEINNAVMGNMTKIMPIFMFFIMIGLPGALALYYTVSNLTAVAQQAYLLRKDVDELEEIAGEPTISETKKAATKNREKKATEAHVTRIVAGEKRRK